MTSKNRLQSVYVSQDINLNHSQKVNSGGISVF